MGCSLTQMDIRALGHKGAGFSADHFYPKGPRCPGLVACGVDLCPTISWHLAMAPASQKDACHPGFEAPGNQAGLSSILPFPK